MRLIQCLSALSLRLKRPAGV